MREETGMRSAEKGEYAGRNLGEGAVTVGRAVDDSTLEWWVNKFKHLWRIL